MQSNMRQMVRSRSVALHEQSRSLSVSVMKVRALKPRTCRISSIVFIVRLRRLNIPKAPDWDFIWHARLLKHMAVASGRTRNLILVRGSVFPCHVDSSLEGVTKVIRMVKLIETVATDRESEANLKSKKDGSYG